MKNLSSYIRNVPDFPVDGIQFKDITTLIKRGDLFVQAVDRLYEPFRQDDISKVVSVEARGFIFGAALAYKLNVGFIPVRKPGKLPADSITQEYQLEYGVDSIEIHSDAVEKKDRILVVDDLLATGGTAAACCQLIEKMDGKIVGLSFLIELSDLKGRERLKDYVVHSVITFPF
jgi:adenine phosphoribosyltransferase